MIGFYDYTVILTYLSLLSAGAGIIISLSGTGHPYIGTFFLLFCGLCDAFDGRVARTKDNRTEMEKNFGIQIDSLSDLVAFGVLPACIGAAMIRTSPFLTRLFVPHHFGALEVLRWFLYALLILYILAALIRLAYFNVTEEERQRTETGSRKFFLGLPVTSASLIFPGIMMMQYMLPMDITIIYFPVIMATGLLFIMPIKVPKPGLKGILIMIGIGFAEFLVMLLLRIFLKR
ncbi:MAG: CDP-alcohol phosphatidyltransferase family protein [Firmicutes bacterium]|nr:CDP-alcohol phosphatidyltransferase family protein [Bacillota bacterium]